MLQLAYSQTLGLFTSITLPTCHYKISNPKSCSHASTASKSFVSPQGAHCECDTQESSRKRLTAPFCLSQNSSRFCVFTEAWQNY